MSTVRTPSLDRKGPTVDPQLISFLTSNSCTQPPRLEMSLLIKKLPTASRGDSSLTVSIRKVNGDKLTTCVPLLGIGLDDHSPIQLRPVVFFML